MADRLKYTAEARAKLSATKERLESDIRGIAERLASHNKSEKVLETHIDEAFSALARCGLRRQSWKSRIESETALGGLIVTAAVAVPSFVPLLFTTPSQTWMLTTSVTLAAVGTLLIAHSFMRGSI